MTSIYESFFNTESLNERAHHFKVSNLHISYVGSIQDISKINKQLNGET